MTLVTPQDKFTNQRLAEMASGRFGDLVKAVVDVKRKLMAVDAELLSDQEEHLLNHGSHQEDLWGINLYPAIEGEDWLEFDSMINVRPVQGNSSRGVDDPRIRALVREIVGELVE